MPQTRAVVGHFVRHSGDVRDLGVVSVKTLVQGRQPEQIRRCLQRRRGAFATPKHGGFVFTKGGCGGFPNVKVLGKDILVGDDTSFLFLFSRKTDFYNKRLHSVCIGTVCRLYDSRIATIPALI
jgi:hypothetical protein